MLRYAVMLVLISAVLLDKGFGCSCFIQPHPCDHLRASAAFVGHVIETRPVKHLENKLWTEGYSMRFSVEEVLSGTLGTEATVETGSGGGDCGTPLPPGGRYLIFANRDANGDLWTGLCNDNRDLSGNPQNLQLLEDLRALIKTRKSSIYGSVKQEDSDSQEQGKPPLEPSHPAQGMIIHARSDGFTAVARTDKEGSYRFDDLPSGKYKVVPELPEGLDFDRRYNRDQVDLVNGACAYVNFALKPGLRISGHVVAAPDREPARMGVSAVRVEPGSRYEKRARVDEGGYFDLWPLPPGDYLVRVYIGRPVTVPGLQLPIYYPGVTGRAAATIVHLQEGQAKDVEVLLPGATATRKVHFAAVDGDGRPMEEIKVGLEDMRFPGEVESEAYVKLDRGGEGDLTVPSGYSFHLHGSSSHSGDPVWCSKPATIAAGTTPVRARFVMDRKGDDCDVEKVDRQRSK